MHPVSDPSVVWHGGTGHRMLSINDSGIECYRCGMAAEGSAWQELIPDCLGPDVGGDHHWMAHGIECIDCAYGDASIGLDGSRADHVQARCKRA